MKSVKQVVAWSPSALKFNRLYLPNGHIRDIDEGQLHANKLQVFDIRQYRTEAPPAFVCVVLGGPT